jgi:hypothetical protein
MLTFFGACDRLSKPHEGHAEGWERKREREGERERDYIGTYYGIEISTSIMHLRIIN